MKILDSHKKNNWTSHGITYLDKNIVMNAASSLSEKLPKFDSINIKIIGRKISGNGFLRLCLKNKKKEIYFAKDIRFTKRSWSEHSFKYNEKTLDSIFELIRGKDSFGRIEIGRIVIDDGRPADVLTREDESKDKNENHLSFYLKNLNDMSLKKKVAVIIPYGIYGGGEVYLKNIFLNTQNAFKVDFLYMSKNKLEFEIENLNINHKHIRNLNRMSATLINNKYDTIIYYNSKKIYDVVSQLKEEERINSKIIEIYHSDFLWGDAVAKLRTRKNIDLIFKVSKDLANDISGISNEAKVHIPVGIDTEFFIRKNNSVLKSELGINKNKTVFGMVARLSPEKNIEYALSLVKDMPHIQLVIVGSGPLDGRLKSFAKENNIDNVLFLGYKKNIKDFYNIFDAFLLTSKMEGTPISILEAMSCGLPVYSTGVGQIRNNFAHLDSFHILSGSLDQDRELIRDYKNVSNYHQNLREYIIDNHNIKDISNKFFINILNSSLKFKRKDESSELLVGDYI